MNLSRNITETQTEEREYENHQKGKFGDYSELKCPRCNRQRVILGTDGKHRCEKCCWCIEDNDYDRELSAYLY